MDHQIPEFGDRQLTLIVYVYLEPRKTLIVTQLPSVNGSSAVRIFCVKTFVVCVVRGLFDFFRVWRGCTLIKVWNEGQLERKSLYWHFACDVTSI